MQHGRNRKLRALTAAFAVAALAAPSTQAAIDTDARHQALVDKVQQVQVDAHHQALLKHGEPGPVVYVTTHAQPASTGGGTDWSSIGIGAGAAFGVILLGSAAAFAGRKRLASA